MGLYLLNISIDTADPNPEYIPENLLYNDQESIVEVILEQLLGFEDAIKEYDDLDAEQNKKKKCAKSDLLVYPPIFNNDHQPLLEVRKKCFLTNDHHIGNAFKGIDSPPPKV